MRPSRKSFQLSKRRSRRLLRKWSRKPFLKLQLLLRYHRLLVDQRSKSPLVREKLLPTKKLRPLLMPSRRRKRAKSTRMVEIPREEEAEEEGAVTTEEIEVDTEVEEEVDQRDHSERMLRALE